MPLVKPKTGGATAGRSLVGRTASKPSAFQYKPRSAEQVRAQATRSVGGRDSFFTDAVQFFTPRVGDNNVRILPPPDDKWGHYGLNVCVHYGIGADESAYLCLKKMKDEACPLCEERDRATSAGEDELADALRPNYRVAVWVIDRAQETKGPLLWNIAGGLDKDISKLCFDPKSGEVLNVDNPDEGYDLSFTRTGEGIKTKYSGIQFARHPSPLADDADVAAEWLAFVTTNNIEECLKFYEYDYITKVFEGQAPPAAKGEEERKPAQRGGKADKPAAAPAKPKIQPRGAAAKPPPPKEPPPDEDVPPTWEELEAMDEDAMGAVIEAFGIEIEEGKEFESVEDLRAFIAEALQIEEPAPEPAKPAAGGSWRDKLNAKLNKKK